MSKNRGTSTVLMAEAPRRLDRPERPLPPGSFISAWHTSSRYPRRHFPIGDNADIPFDAEGAAVWSRASRGCTKSHAAKPASPRSSACRARLQPLIRFLETEHHVDARQIEAVIQQLGNRPGAGRGRSRCRGESRLRCGRERPVLELRRAGGFAERFRPDPPPPRCRRPPATDQVQRRQAVNFSDHQGLTPSQFGIKSMSATIDYTVRSPERR